MSIGPPSSFSQKEGETIDQAIQRVMAPKPNWFIETLLPTNVPKPEYINGYGASDLTPSGAIPSATPADAAPKNIPIFRPDAPTESV